MLALEPFLARCVICCASVVALASLSGDSWVTVSQFMPWLAALTLPGADLASGRVDAALARGASVGELILRPTARRSAPAVVLAFLLLLQAVHPGDAIVALAQVVWVLLLGILLSRFFRSAPTQILVVLASFTCVAAALRLPPYATRGVDGFESDRFIVSSCLLAFAAGSLDLFYLSCKRPFVGGHS